MAFQQSIAVFDRQNRLQSWNSGFAAEFAAAAGLIADGNCLTDIAAFAYAQDGIRRTDLAEVPLPNPGDEACLRYRDQHGNTILVVREATASGHICRSAMAVPASAEDPAIPTIPTEVTSWIRRAPDGSYSYSDGDDEAGLFFGRAPGDPAVTHDSLLAHFDFGPGERERLVEHFALSAETLDIVVTEQSFRDFADRQRWVRLTCTPEREADGSTLWSCLMRDITQERRAEGQVELLQSVVVQWADGVMIIGTDVGANIGTGLETRVLYVNPAFERLTGFSAAQLVGESPLHLVANDPDGMITAQIWELGVMEFDETSSIEVEISRADGTPVWIESRAAIVQRFSADSYRGVILMRDITERRRVRAELLKAKETAEAASRAKDEFLANMSHEIRTPMNGVLGMTELLLDTPLDADQRKYAGLVQESGEALLTIINDILDISKLEAGKVELETIDFDLVDTVESAATLMAARGREKNIDLGVYVAPAAQTTFRGDPTRIRQILLNLIGNGVKFTESGSVSVEVSIIASAPGADARQVRARFEVTDTGIGMAEEVRSRMFEKFSQADSSITRRYGGTGLGLAICKQLIDLMGGEIGVTSKPGEGTTFWFEIPLSLSSQPLTDMAALLPQLKGMRALALDDIAMNLDIISRQLRGFGMEVTCCLDAFDALAELERASHRGRPYDIVFLDQMMPGLAGEEVAARIRDNPRVAGLKLVLVSSAGPHGLGEAARRLLDVVLDKPIRRQDLLRALSLLHVTGPAAAAAPAPAAPQSAPAGQGLRVLLAEDNKVNQQFARALLVKAGHAVDIVENGHEAAAAAARGGYDVVLMDVQMPELDGVEATRQIRALPSPAAQVHIIALTANAMTGAEEQYLSAGMDDYVSKPIKSAILLAKLGDLVARLAPSPEGPPDEPAAAVEADPSDPDIDPTCLDELKSIMSPEEIQGLLETYLGDSGRRIARIGELSANGNLPDAAREAHALISTAGAVGALRVGALARSLETACKMPDPATAGRLIGELQEAGRSTSLVLGNWLGHSAAADAYADRPGSGSAAMT